MTRTDLISLINEVITTRQISFEEKIIKMLGSQTNEASLFTEDFSDRTPRKINQEGLDTFMESISSNRRKSSTSTTSTSANTPVKDKDAAMMSILTDLVNDPSDPIVD